MLLAMHLNSNRCGARQQFKESFQPLQELIPIPFPVLWDRKAGTTPGRLLQMTTTTIPQCAQAVSRSAFSTTHHSALGKHHLPLRYLRRTQSGVSLWAQYYLHFLVQKRWSFLGQLESGCCFLPSLFSPFFSKSHIVKCIFATKVSKMQKFRGWSKKWIRTFT